MIVKIKEMLYDVVYWILVAIAFLTSIPLVSIKIFLRVDATVLVIYIALLATVLVLIGVLIHEKRE